MLYFDRTEVSEGTEVNKHVHRISVIFVNIGIS